MSTQRPKTIGRRALLNASAALFGGALLGRRAEAHPEPRIQNVNTNSSPSKLRITDLRVATVRKPGPSPRSKKKVVIGDGAIWIWNLADQHFPGAIQIVDIYHARQHLWELSAKLFPNDNKARQRWTARCLGQLDCGKIEVLVKTLRDLHPAEAALNHRESLKNPPKTIDEYLNALESLGLTQTVSVLREYMF